jgi:hypothetical protein
VGDGWRRADFWRRRRRSGLRFGRRSLWRGGERLWFDGLGLDGHGRGWRLLRRRGSGMNWRSDSYRRGRQDWGGDLWEGSGNGDGWRRLRGGGFFGGGDCGRRGGGKFGLEFADDAL